MALADQEAKLLNHEYVGTEHILLGLIREGKGLGAHVVKRLGVDLEKAKAELVKIVPCGTEAVGQARCPLTPRAKNVIVLAHDEVRQLNHNYVGTEHLLLALVREEHGVAGQVLANLGLKPAEVRTQVLSILGHDV